MHVYENLKIKCTYKEVSNIDFTTVLFKTNLKPNKYLLNGDFMSFYN